MVGTSVDAIDDVLVSFKQNLPSIVSTYSLPISEKVRASIHTLAISGNDEIAQLRDLDRDIALLSCTAIEKLCPF